VRNELSTQLGEVGINILGVLPEDRTLFTLTVGELAEHIQGEILNSAEKSVELVENFMLGAMCVDPGPEYFGRKANKAVVVRGERPDMQLAALETSIRCLVLSGNTAPIPPVLYGAQDKEIPIILTKGDTIATVMSIEDALSKTRFNQEKKLPKLTEIMEQHFNFQALYQGLSLAKQPN
jgi:BioD-like phosphotransacetylase family protein